MMNSRRCFPLLALIALTLPLFGDSPEIPVGATVPSPAPGSRSAVAAATDGTDFFVVWADGRTPGRGTIVGTRVSRSGQVLDPLGIRIASAPAGLSSPTAVWDGTAYVVVWARHMDSGTTLQRDEVWATRVDRDGRILIAPRVISEAGAEQATTTSGVYAASNGDVTVVAYRHFYWSAAVRVAVLDREGNVIRRELLANYAPDLSRGISVAATGSRFVVTWATSDLKVLAASLTSQGRALQAPVQIGDGDDPAVATDGTSVAFVWRRWTPHLGQTLLLSRMADADLTQLGDARMLAGDQLIDWPSLLWRGDRYEAIAGQQSSTPTRQYPYGLLSVEFDGDSVDAVSRRGGGTLTNAVGPQPVSVTNGSEVLVAHRHPDNHRTQIVARLYRGSSSEPEVQQLLSWSGNAHERPAIATSASGHLAAWMENLSVYATRVDADGHSLDGRGVKLTESGFSVRAAFDGTNYVVAWLDNGFIGVRSIVPLTGAIVAEVQVPVAAWTSEGLALAVSPDAAYLAWVDAIAHRVRAARVSFPSGTAYFPLTVSPEGMIAGYPSMAWNGSMLLVTWNELRVASGNLPRTPAWNVRAARVSQGLTLLDPEPLIVIPAGESVLGPPSIASNGEDWLVVVDRDERELVARRVLRNGNVEDKGASAIGAGVAPAAMWDGTRYVIAYKAGGTLDQPEAPLLLATLPATGALPALRGTLVSPGVVSPPSIALTATGHVAALYTKVSYRPEHTGVERSYLRVMDSSPRRRTVRR